MVRRYAQEQVQASECTDKVPGGGGGPGGGTSVLTDGSHPTA